MHVLMLPLLLGMQVVAVQQGSCGEWPVNQISPFYREFSWVIVNNGAVNAQEQCVNSSTLLEFYCAHNAGVALHVDCGAVLAGGRCVENADGGFCAVSPAPSLQVIAYANNNSGRTILHGVGINASVAWVVGPLPRVTILKKQVCTNTSFCRLNVSVGPGTYHVMTKGNGSGIRAVLV